jgi:anti-sigma B factor antagonist
VSGDETPVSAEEDRPELSVSQAADGVCVISVSCELDMTTTPALGQLLTQELAGQPRSLVVDLSRCEFMSSSGLAVLVAAREQAAQSGTHLALAGLTRTVQRAFTAVGLNPLFDIHASSDEAVAGLRAADGTDSGGPS